MLQEVIKNLALEFNIEDREKIYKILTGRDSTKPLTSLDELAHEICIRHDMTIKQLKSKSHISNYSEGRRRWTPYVDARQEFCNAARFKYDYGIKEIGEFLELHWSTVIHYNSYRKSANPVIKRKIVKLVEKKKPKVKYVIKDCKIKMERPPAEYTNIKFSYT